MLNEPEPNFIKMCDLILAQNLQCEEHQVTTSDGYVLNQFRVRKAGTPEGAKAVFLMHGLFSESTTWAVHGAQSLSVVLANQGYDVWVGNNRGNVYGRRNVKSLTTDKFFDYSFYENAKYDLITQFDFAYKNSGSKKMTYVGHS